jgi:hypothetical protein
VRQIGEAADPEPLARRGRPASSLWLSLPAALSKCFYYGINANENLVFAEAGQSIQPISCTEP